MMRFARITWCTQIPSTILDVMRDVENGSPFFSLEEAEDMTEDYPSRTNNFAVSDKMLVLFEQVIG